MPAPALGFPTPSKSLMLQYFSRHPTGTPFYIEDWEYARGWSPGGTGTFDIVQQKTERYPAVFNGKSMCKLETPGVVGGYIRLAYITGLLPNHRLGIEVNFDFPYSSLATLSARMARFQVGFWLEEGPSPAFRRDVYVDYCAITNELSVCDGTTLHLLASNVMTGAGYYTHGEWGIWHNLKFIADLDENQLVRLYFNDLDFDLSNISVVPLAPYHNTKWLNTYIRLMDRAVPIQYHIYLGNIILTMEES